MSETREFVVSAADAGLRLDVFLARALPDWSRSQVQRQIRSGQVSVGPDAIFKAGERVQAGQRVAVRAARHELRATPEELPLDIVFEDDDLVVVNKPAGMVVHVGAGVRSGTLVNALLHHVRTLARAGGDLRPGIVHRLDRMTSGLVVVAKNDEALRSLAQQFKSREVHKTYLALVHGRVAPEQGRVAAPVGRDPHRRVRMRTSGLAAREASTGYRVVRRFPRFTLLEVHPLTGRTHQIRVHLASIGHPVVGDTLYGAPARLRLDAQEEKTLARNFLHAAAIRFRHPRTGAVLEFEAPLPAELRTFLGRVEAQAGGAEGAGARPESPRPR